MKIPSTIADLAHIDWTSPDVRHLSLCDLHVWDQVASQQRVVQPVPDEVAWAGTELDVHRTVL